MSDRTTEGATGRSMRVTGVGTTVPPGTTPRFTRQRAKPSDQRSEESERERRHREREIAAWLRSLSR